MYHTLQYLLLTIIAITTTFHTINSNKTNNILITKPKDRFPSIQDTETFIHLSKAVYKINTPDACKEYHYKEDIKCIFQQKVKKYGTNVMIVTSNKLNFIAVIYAGTDSYGDVVNADVDIRLVPFGPKDDTFDDNVMVHNGFNNGVFEHDVFHNLLHNVKSFLGENSGYRLCTSGHSLGGAQSLLTAVAFSHHFPDRFIQHISIGEPMTGDDSWVEYVNRNDSLSIWRFVYELDLVARMCGEKHTTYKHVGHTVQLSSKDCAKAYYWHHGDETLGYKGVPSNWESHAMKSFTIAVADHLAVNYNWYMEHRASKDSDCYYVNHFEMDDSVTVY